MSKGVRKSKGPAKAQDKPAPQPSCGSAAPAAPAAAPAETGKKPEAAGQNPAPNQDGSGRGGRAAAPPPLALFIHGISAVRINIRLLTPDKKGIARRITAAIESVGGIVVDIHVARKMRGMSETAVAVTLADAGLRKPVIDSLGAVPGVAILSTLDIPGTS